MPNGLLETCALLFALTLAGGLLPLFGRWSERGLHLFVSISAGIFLGLVFLHLLPEMAGMGHDQAAHAPGTPDSKVPWVATLVGFLMLFFVEKIWLEGRAREDQHRALGAATYLGLLLHTLITGLGLAAVFGEHSVLVVVLGATIAHKASEAFSLASFMRLAGLSTRASVGWLALYSAVAPTGLAIGLFYDVSHSHATGLITGLACGTFLYVAVCDLLPEVFHGAKKRLLPILGVLGGVLAAGLGDGPFGWLAQQGVQVLRASWAMLLDFSPWLLLGFLIGGILAQWLKPEQLVRWLKRENLSSVASATLLGAPLPLCSCSVLPLAYTLRKSGASKGSTVAFLVSTPETGVDSVAVSWALLDPVLAVLRPLGALVSAFCAGAAVSWDARRRPAPEPALQSAPLVAGEACCARDGDAPLPAMAGPKGHFVSRALRYGFIDLLDDLAPSLLLGLLISGLVSVVLPANLLSGAAAQGFSGLLLMLVLGVPIYVCAAASTPIAAALLAKGLSPGAALVFLLAGPATNLGAMLPLAKLLGRRTLLVYLAALAVITLLLGMLTNWIYPWLIEYFDLTPVAGDPNANAEGLAMAPTLLGLVCASVVSVLLLVALLRRYGRPLGSLRAAPAQEGFAALPSAAPDHGHAHDHGHAPGHGHGHEHRH